MIISANAYYNEEDNAEVKCRLRASVNVCSELAESDDKARALARSLYQNLLFMIPSEKGGKCLCG